VNATAILGLWYRPLPGLDLAVSARLIPVRFNARSRLAIQAVNLKLDKPAVLGRDGRPDDSVTFSFTLPPRLRLGARYAFLKDGVEKGDIELDFGYEAWSMLDAYIMDGTGLVSTVLGQNVPIGRIVVPRKWNDVYSLRLGGDWNVLPGLLTLRGGFTWESSAAPDAYAYIDVFPGQRFGPSAGFSVGRWGVTLSASYSYVFTMPVVVTEGESQVFQQTPGSPCKEPYTDPTTCSQYYYGRPSATANAGVYLSHYHLVSVSLGYRF
jgi:long-chain fatty acid transport protein